jgi:hypothetical protein
MIDPSNDAGIVIANKEAGGGHPRQFVATGDVSTREGARQNIQGAQRRNDQIARRPNAIVHTAPRPYIDNIIFVGIAIANKSLLSVPLC